MENRYKVNIDLKSREIRTDARFRTGDTNSGTMEITLTNNSLVENITGQNITFNFQKADGKTVTQDMTNGVKIIDGEKGIFEVVLRNETLQVAGKVNCNITFTKDDEITSTIGFIFTIDQSIGDGEISKNYISAVETKLIEWESAFYIAETDRAKEFDIISDTYEKASHDNVNIEMVNARKGETNLSTRLDKDKAENVNSINTMGGIVTNHTNSINTMGSQLANNASQQSENEKLLKGALYSSSSKIGTINLNTDITYYQAVVKNPIDVAYTNMPIALKVNFSRGEVPTIDYLIVKKADGTILPFQWEGAIHPNYLATENLAAYSDGSLKSGKLWIMDSLAISATNVYTIEAHSTLQGNVFTVKVIYSQNVTAPTAPKDDFNCGIVAIEFDYTVGGYQLKQYTINGVATNHSGDLLFMPFIKDTAVASVNAMNLTTTLWNLSKSYKGEGIVFIDYTVVSILATNTNIQITTRYRIFANGMIDIDCRFLALDTLLVRQVQGFGGAFKTLIGSDRAFTTINNSGCTSVLTNGNASVTYQILNTLLAVDTTDVSITYNTQIGNPATSDVNGVSVFWSSSGDKIIPKNSFFYIKSYILPFASTNIPMNMLSAHATKYSKTELQQRYLALCKKFVDHMHGFAFGTTFLGLKAYESLAYNKLNNIVREYENDTSISDFITGLTTKYGGYTENNFQSKWLSGEGYGVEYIGRDTSPIMIFRQQCLDANKTTSYNTLTTIIHSLADFYVWLETYSGGLGNIKLQSYGEDNMNAEATAMKALHNSLNIVADTTRQATYNRIKARFESTIQYKNILPYSATLPLYRWSQSHYHAFSLFEYLDTISDVSTLTFDLASYINQNVTSSGKLVEIGFEATPTRFGFVHSSSYMAYIMYLYGTISSLETACKLMENIISKCYPNGGHQFPLDGWKNVNGGTIDQIIEVQSCYEPLMKIIFTMP